MLPKDESQQNAELRQAFLNHLPRRIELVQKRVQRFIKGQFDINSLSLLSQEVQFLAGASGKYAMLGPSERLYALELKLASALHDARELDESGRATLQLLAQQLSLAAEAKVKLYAVITDYLPVLSESGEERPRYSVPPSEYWRRYATDEVTPLNSDGPYAGLAPRVALTPTAPATEIALDDLIIEGADELVIGSSAAEQASTASPQFDDLEIEVEAPPAAPELEVEFELPAAPVPQVSRIATSAPRRAFYVVDGSAFSRELSEKLGVLGLEVDALASLSELTELLGELAADLVVIDVGFSEQLESLSEFLKSVRARMTAKMPVFAFAEAKDLGARIRAMRAGIDVLLPAQTSVDDALARIRESLEIGMEAAYRVLIVEDDRSQAFFAESVLRKSGMETCIVTDPLRTLEELERFRPDLILMDLYMPGIDGMELTSIIREREQFASTPIVFLSGEQDSDKQFDAIGAGGDDFLAKPIRPKHLISSVTNRARRARALNQRKERGESRDQGSGLYSRAKVLDQLAAALAVEERSRIPGGLLFLELDGIAALRDQLGLGGMESLLHQLGLQVAQLCQGDETAARYGDGSFLLLSSARDGATLLEVARTLRQRLALQAFEVEGKLISLNLSAGVCPFANSLADPAAMLNCAERALVQARSSSGDDRVVLFTPEAQKAELSEEEQLVDAIKRALKQDDFQLLFQPIVTLNDSGEEQYEVLLRLQGPNGKVYTGSQLVADAEKHGLMAEVDRWMLGRCLATLDARQRQGGNRVRLYVNQSAASLRDGQRIAWLKQGLEARGLDPNSIALEFRMTDIMHELKHAIPFFQSVRALGCKLTLDAFESSLTSLQVLSYLHVDYLKLASKYLSPGAGGLVEELKALIAAAHDGGRKVIAARVENAQSAAALWSLGVDFIQGNFVQQPGAELAFDFKSSSL